MERTLQGTIGSALMASELRWKTANQENIGSLGYYSTVDPGRYRIKNEIFQAWIRQGAIAATMNRIDALNQALGVPEKIGSTFMLTKLRWETVGAQGKIYLLDSYSTIDPTVSRKSSPKRLTQPSPQADSICQAASRPLAPFTEIASNFSSALSCGPR
jgi:hypothetical protein